MAKKRTKHCIYCKIRMTCLQEYAIFGIILVYSRSAAATTLKSSFSPKYRFAENGIAFRFRNVHGICFANIVCNQKLLVIEYSSIYSIYFDYHTNTCSNSQIVATETWKRWGWRELLSVFIQTFSENWRCTKRVVSSSRNDMSLYLVWSRNGIEI